MDLIQILKDDYERFPQNPTYSLYAADVYFEDPMTKFRGIDQYQKMVSFIAQWFHELQLDLHEISQSGNIITTRWTLSWTTPLPWKPRITIPGWSELKINEAGLIISHIDYWECSRFSVLKQHFLMN